VLMTIEVETRQTAAAKRTQQQPDSTKSAMASNHTEVVGSQGTIIICKDNHMLGS